MLPRGIPSHVPPEEDALRSLEQAEGPASKRGSLLRVVERQIHAREGLKVRQVQIARGRRAHHVLEPERLQPECGEGGLDQNDRGVWLKPLQAKQGVGPIRGLAAV